MDIVIPLHQWTTNNFLELKYALRSFELFLPHDRIVIIGCKPNWIKGILFMPFHDDPQPYFREANIFLKLKYYIEHGTKESDDRFVFANDDHFLLKPFEDLSGKVYPHKGTLKESLDSRRPDDPYRKTIDNTIKVSGSNQNYNFDVHAPMIMHFANFRNVFMKEDCKIKWTTRYGFLLKSLYAYKIKAVGYKSLDFKINEPFKDAVDAIFKDIPFFSTSDMAFDGTMATMMEMAYPNKSKYEI